MNIKPLACLALLAFCGSASSQENADRTTVSFSDPTHPGVLHVGLVTGTITVKGRDIKDVIIDTHDRGGNWRFRGRDDDVPPGLHRLPQQPSINVEEQNNRMTVGSPNVNRFVDLEIQVPLRTSLELSTVNGGDIRVEGVDGELELSNVNGSISLTGVSGSVVAHTVNGKVTATLTRATPQKPMAFTSLNGNVDVTLPPATKANLKLRTDNGSVFTDFELHMPPRSSGATIEDTRQSGGRYRVEVNKVIYGSLNGGGADIELRTFSGNIYVRKAN